MSDGDRTYLRCLEHYRTENEKKKKWSSTHLCKLFILFTTVCILLVKIGNCFSSLRGWCSVSIWQKGTSLKQQ